MRLVSYAIHWIKAEIHEYVLKNWRMVKVATTKAQRKLFFNLRSHKQETHNTFTPEQVEAVARELNVKPEVMEMETVVGRRYGAGRAGRRRRNSPRSRIWPTITTNPPACSKPSAATVCRWKAWKRRSASSISVAAASSRPVGCTSTTTVRAAPRYELADEFGVSAERIRQIEAAAMKKMKGALQAFA